MSRVAVTVIGTNLVMDYGSASAANDAMAALATPAQPEGGLDYEQMRMDRCWPTPNRMRRTADALDILTFAKYGDVLRWFADLADASLHARLGASPDAE